MGLRGLDHWYILQKSEVLDALARAMERRENDIVFFEITDFELEVEMHFGRKPPD